MQVEDVMKAPKAGKTKFTVNQGESIDNAALLMKQNNMKSVSVVDDDGKVVGLVTRDSIIQASDDLNEDFFID